VVLSRVETDEVVLELGVRTTGAPRLRDMTETEGWGGE
jgi:hypothetical protein